MIANTANTAKIDALLEQLEDARSALIAEGGADRMIDNLERLMSRRHEAQGHEERRRTPRAALRRVEVSPAVAEHEANARALIAQL